MAEITIKQLEALVQVADHGSFRKAAAVLNTTQPNISTRLKVLEQTLDTSLMERNAGRVELTPIGTELLAKARRVIGSVDEFLVAADKKELFDGTLRLGVTEMLVHSWLPPFLASFSARYPKVHVELTVDFSVNLSAALQNNTLDLALQNGPFETENSASVKMGSYPWVWVAAPTLVKHTTKTNALNAITTHPEDQSVRFVPSNSLSACLKLATSGLGVACLPEAMIKDSVKQKQLQQLDYEWIPDALEFYARYNAERVNHVIEDAVTLAKSASID